VWASDSVTRFVGLWASGVGDFQYDDDERQRKAASLACVVAKVAKI